jgi:hypothetical protein
MYIYLTYNKMVYKEAQARIKINKLLEEFGWRFESGKNGKANIFDLLLPNVSVVNDKWV